ncbi:uncharacterized protein LOC125200484 [Salvia hispanica]|uniref:uncharacterized protein LOC125200484 n=1 Tax=Salvia hispanica TaxID=49212 RepID=UPI00200909B7|nr:uncharacterized protein LOC125200484 [Salvia hispanica]
MIHSILRRNFISSFSTNLRPPDETVARFFLPVLHFSTSTEKKSVNNPALYDLLLQKHKFSPQVALIAASASTQSKTPEEYDSMLSFFREIGFSKSQVEKAVKFLPQLLSSNLEKTIKPKIRVFQDMGFPRGVIAEVLSKEPKILHRSATKALIPRLTLLRELLGSNKCVSQVLRKAQWMLSTDLRTNMLPNVELLRSCGVSMQQILTICCYAPRFFLNRPEVVRKYVDQADELGVSRGSRVFVYVVAVIGSMANGRWERKIQAFRDILECSEDDILRMVRQSPQVFTVSEDKLVRVKELLIGTGKYTASCIVGWPKSVMYSAEQRYKPRIEVLEMLERRGLIRAWPHLPALCKMSNDVFCKKFVSPHLDEVGEFSWPVELGMGNEMRNSCKLQRG